jgi:hypothetical protein
MVLVCTSCNPTRIAKKNVVIPLDSSFFDLGDGFYARTTVDANAQLGDIFIYQQKKPDWLTLIQHIGSLSADDALFGIRTFRDFNEDGLKDLLVIYGTGAGGSNELNYLFVQKYAENRRAYFKYVKASDYPPNLHYDTARKVVESTMFHGGVTFVDYKVIGDSLVEQGGVDVTAEEKWVIRIHYLIDKHGNRIETKRDSVYDGFEDFYSR